MYRILIVEDDMGIASAMKKQIEMWDLEVSCVENFRNVLEEFSEFAPPTGVVGYFTTFL